MTAWIRLDGEGLGFAAAHFATFGGGLEPLHGHNYQVIVEVQGGLTHDSWVTDFSYVKSIVRDLCEELDHKFLLQGQGEELRSACAGGLRTIEFGSRRYVMPEEDVFELPIDNTTAERLAEWFAGRIAAALLASGHSNMEVLRVGIKEGPGQSGWYSMTLRDG